MITIIGNSADVSARWAKLENELAEWQDEGRIATLWWRDDDAVAPSGRLDELLAVADGVPVALAVVPALAQEALAKALDASAPQSLFVLQHGWRHANHAGAGKQSEFPPSRAEPEITTELVCGQRRIEEMFGARALAVLAPPWNRFEEASLPLLRRAGICALSTINPRRAADPYPGVRAANVHVDLVAWRSGGGFIGEEAALDGIIAHLKARRRGAVDADEPTGILTHHLVQEGATLGFQTALTRLSRSHPAVAWLDATEVFAPIGNGWTCGGGG